MKLTKAQRTALESVRDGRVTRVYSMRGNRLDAPKGVGEITIAGLLTRHLISEATASFGVYSTTAPLVITDAGRKALEDAK